MNQIHEAKLLTRQDAREYFQDAVQSALFNQKLSASDESVVYIVNLLLAFLRSERLFDKTPDGLMIKPLAMIYGDALEAESETNRAQALQRLGDVALFVSGLYANSLNRCLVDIDYYIAMGGNAYSYLADSSVFSRRLNTMKMVFDELSDKFAGFVDVLSEVGDQSNISGNSDIMRLYEIWLYTGSKRVANKLKNLGIHPVRTGRNTH